ncbi:MAG TPA: Hsp70 family protein [Pseudonocardiaceae bacterium]|nr:Hsp70 family protein [Pseudonocardiaceae bacterium]
MPYVLGIDVGTGHTRAAISRHTPNGWSDPVLVGLGAQQPTMPTVVHLDADRSATVGDEAEQRSAADPTRIARGFSARIGDDVPFLLGGAPCTPQELTAVLIRWVTDLVAGREGGPAAQIVVTHRAGWGAYRQNLLHHELARQGLTDVTLRPEPVAVAEGYAPAGDLVAVVGFGTAAEAAVLRRRDDGVFELAGQAEGDDDLGGGGFDDAIMECVRGQAGSALDQLDPTEPSAWLALAELRGVCVTAKELLSTETEVIVPVRLPAGPTEVRVTRADFERIIRPSVVAGVQLLRRVTRSVGVESAELGSVVLVGGSGRIPLVAGLVGAVSPNGVVVAAEPDATVAVGAAFAARRLLTGPDRPVPALAHTEVIQRSAIALYTGEETVADPAESEVAPPPRPPIDIIPLDLPTRGWTERLLPRVRPAVLTVSTIVLLAIGVALTFLFEAGNHQTPTSPLHLGPPRPAANTSVSSSNP